MKETTLEKYVQQHGQTATAKDLGLTQGAVWQMLRAKRAVFVYQNSNGQLEAFEKKPVGKGKAA